MLMIAQYKLRGGQEMKEDLSCDLLIPLKDVFVLIILLFEDFEQKSPVSFGSVLTVWALLFPSLCLHLDQTKKKKIVEITDCYLCNTVKQALAP